MSNIKSFVSGFLVATVLIGLSSIVLAQNQNITAMFNNIKIKIDGDIVKTDVEPFVYNGRTFVPVRFVAEKFGKVVSWDEKSQTVDIKNTNYIKKDENNITVYTIQGKEYVENCDVSTYINTNINKKFNLLNTSLYLKIHENNGEYFLINNIKNNEISKTDTYDIIFKLPVEILKRTDLFLPYLSYDYCKNTLLPYLNKYIAN